MAKTTTNLEDKIRSGFWSLVPPEVRPLAPVIEAGGAETDLVGEVQEKF